MYTAGCMNKISNWVNNKLIYNINSLKGKNMLIQSTALGKSTLYLFRPYRAGLLMGMH
jgi:hypothetical protein